MPNSNVTPNPSQNESAKDTGPEDPNEQYIEHRVPIINADGVQDTKVHRVKLSEWKAYEKEHKL